VARQLEPRVRRKRFSALGAASFDADVRALTAFFARRSSRRAARDRFARLAAMARLLSLEEPELEAEALREVGLEDARAILALRLDVDAAAVAALRPGGGQGGL